MPDAEPLAATIQKPGPMRAARDPMSSISPTVAPRKGRRRRRHPGGGNLASGATASAGRSDRVHHRRDPGAAAVTLTRSPFFAARTIEVNGASHVARADGAAHGGRHAGHERLHAGCRRRRAPAGGDPWIAEATVTHDLPRRSIIDIDERSRLSPSLNPTASLRVGRRRRGVPGGGRPARRGADAIDRHGRCGRRCEPSPGAVGARPGRSPRMAPSLRRRVDSVSVVADGQLRVDLTSGGERRPSAKRPSCRRRRWRCAALLRLRGGAGSDRRSPVDVRCRPLLRRVARRVGDDGDPMNHRGCCHRREQCDVAKRLTDLRFLSSVPAST